jgi:hypothetical protein
MTSRRSVPASASAVPFLQVIAVFQFLLESTSGLISLLNVLGGLGSLLVQSLNGIVALLNGLFAP